MIKNITKLLFGTINKKETIELRNWLKDTSKQDILESYIRDYHDLNLATLKNNIEEAFNKVCHQIDNTENPVQRLVPKWTKYAAAIVLLFGIGLFYQQGIFSLKDDDVLIPKEEFITLELDNGTIQIIDFSQTKEVKGLGGKTIGVQNQDQISYFKTTEKEDLVFNTLKTPNGKKFKLVLSDGTLVYLNAGSSLRYPVNFLEEGIRKVFLTGEAYFEVTKNETNPFIVNVDDLNVTVLGTEFNVSAYSEDISIDVVLVEGVVNLANNNDLHSQIIKLSPGEKGSFEHNSSKINVDQVNTSLYTSWIQGNLVFRDLTFNSILKKLERHYNIEIVNTNTELGNQVFHASFDDVDIEELLGYFNNIHSIDFKIKENKVLIK
jgi:hypothetical protein